MTKLDARINKQAFCKQTIELSVQAFKKREISAILSNLLQIMQHLGNAKTQEVLDKLHLDQVAKWDIIHRIKEISNLLTKVL